MVESDDKHLLYLRRLDENIRKGLHLGGKLVEDKAQDWAPVAKGVMMRSVDTTPARVIAGKYIVLIGSGPEAPYAKYTEEDKYVKKRRLGRKSKLKGAKMPWLRPALKDQKDDILKVVSAAIVNTRV